MKKPILLAFLALGLAFTSCNKDDDAPVAEQQATKLQGTWQLQSQLYDGEQETLNDCELESTIAFKSDNTMENDYRYMSNDQCMSDITSGTWEVISEGKIKVSESGNGFSISVNGNFTISNDILTLIYTDEDGESKQIYKKI